MSKTGKLIAVAMTFGLAGTSMAHADEAAGGPAPPVLNAFPVTEITAGHNGHFIVKAYINHEPVNVLVDTGASSVTLSHEDAESIGIDTDFLDYKFPANTANGVVHFARIKLDRVEIDNIQVRDVDAAVLPKGATNITLLGMTFLGRLDSFTVEDGRLILED